MQPPIHQLRLTSTCPRPPPRPLTADLATRLAGWVRDARNPSAGGRDREAAPRLAWWWARAPRVRTNRASSAQVEDPERLVRNRAQTLTHLWSHDTHRAAVGVWDGAHPIEFRSVGPGVCRQ
ncbi:MAG: hypothetical protein ACRDRO_04410 [Pseudonocardiaceae bacterium]